jgi:hypothetical protein
MGTGGGPADRTADEPAASSARAPDAASATPLDAVADDEFDDEFVMDPDDAPADDVGLVANAKRRHGLAGGMLAAGMLGLDQALGRKPKEEIPVVVTSNSDPLDIDTDGMEVAVDADRSVLLPPTERTPPVVAPGKRRRR